MKKNDIRLLSGILQKATLACWFLILGATSESPAQNLLKHLQTKARPQEKILAQVRIATTKSLPLNSNNYYTQQPSGTMGLATKSTYRYDGAGRLISETEQELPSYQILKRDSIVYDLAGNETFRGTFNWNASNNTWTLNAGYRFSYIYNTSGKLTEKLVERSMNSGWINSEKITFTYSNGKLTTEQYYLWPLNAWELQYKVNYLYAPGGLTPNELISERKDYFGNMQNEEKLTNVVWQNFSEGKLQSYIANTWKNNVWATPKKVTIVYDALGGYVETSQEWISNNWINLSRYAFLFDNHMNYIGYKGEVWVINGWVTNSQEQRLHTYNATNDITETIFNYWYHNFNTLLLSERRVYSNFLRISGTSEQLPQLSAKIYPNPVSVFLNLQLENQPEVNVKITDLAGREIRNEVLPPGSTRIDVENLLSGVYLLHLETEKGKTVKKIIKK